jgi:acyl dehydratase
MINGFADATGDQQAIHVDAECCAKDSLYGLPIAHGFLTWSVLAKLLMDVDLIQDDITQAANVGFN